MKNVLIIGCSHSTGFSFYENNKDKKSNIESRTFGDYGWYTYVDKFKKCDNVFVISTPGSGYAFWCSIFYLGLHQTRFFEKFDTIIIQESHEFRFKVPHETQLIHHLKHDFIRFHENTIENIEVHVIDIKNDALEIADFSPQPREENLYLTEKGLNYLNQSTEILKSMIFGSLYRICHVVSQMRQNIYVWSMADQYINSNFDNWRRFECKHIKRLNSQVDDIYTHLWKDGGLTIPYEEGQKTALQYMVDNNISAHANKKGNKIIGELINKAL
tara:strand:- start:89 stop:904 length:816 start_codon:yes stop_codon:yes gene_type:complete